MSDQGTTPPPYYFMDTSQADHVAEIVAAKVATHQTVREQSSQARYLDTSAAGATDANGYLWLPFPAVPQGFRDRILGVVIGTANVTSTAPGVASVCVCSSNPFPNGVDGLAPLSIVRDFTSELPNVSFYDYRQLVVGQGRFLGVQVYDSTTSEDSYTVHIAYIREPLLGNPNYQAQQGGF